MNLPRLRRSGLTLLAGMAALMSMPVVLVAQERIAYVAAVDTNSDIWSMKTDATDPHQLTKNPAGDGDPSYSSDGSKIVFVSVRDGNQEIYVMRADGTDQKRLTSNAVTDNDPSWSPDGTKIVFVSFRDGSADVFQMNADGSNQVNLTNFPGGNETEPSYSPDGKKIAFRGLRDGGINIFVMKPDGSEQTPLTEAAGINTEPVFTPDGSKIVFRSNRDGNLEIYVMDSDGKNPVNLTNTPAASEFSPAVSPDGNHIIFTDGSELYVIDPDGQNRKNITNSTGSEGDPSWGAANVPPAITDLEITPQVDEGSFATLKGKIVDENEGDSFMLAISWTPLMPTVLVEVPAGTRTFEFSTKYWDDKPDGTPSDTYPVKVTVDDHRFGKGSAETQITVNNVDPILVGFAINPSTVVLGGSVTLSGTVEDPGYISDQADEALRVSINWGDGASEIMDLFMPGPITPPTHKYAAVGTYHVTVKVTDNDMGETVQPFDVVVSPPPPPAAPSDLRVDFIAANRIQIVWTDNSNNEDGFIIESCAQRGCNNFIEVGRVFPDIRHFVHGNLFSNTQYYYRVRAFNVGGTSTYTDVVSAKTLKK
jgi:dipeptidyl aminopeptidase/acylaminoacyl peptidase